MVRVPVDVTSVPGIVALSLVELRKVVVLSDPFNRTTELATKFVPSTVSENPPLPTVTVSGAMEVVVGTGFAGATITAFERVRVLLAFDAQALSEYAMKYALYVPFVAGAVMLNVGVAVAF